MRKKENRTVLPINNFVFGLLAALVLPVLICTGCPNALEEILGEESAVPAGATEALAVAKTAETQKSAAFTLTSSNTGEWKVYDTETGGEPLTMVSASFDAPILTLTAAGDDLAPGTYWVSVTEEGKTESPRLGLTVEPYVRPDQSSTPAAEEEALTVVKTSAAQKAVPFVLTSTHTGEWKVYAGVMGGEPLTTVSAAFSAPTLTLTAAEDDLASGTYWVSVTEEGKAESPRLGLTVAPQEGSAAPVAENRFVSKTGTIQKSAAFTLTSGNTGEWKVYDAETGGEPLTTVSAGFSAPILTLTAAGDDLAPGTYWVSVTEEGKTESPRLGLTVEKYLPAVLTLGVEADVITAKADSGTPYTVTGSGGTSVAEVNGYAVIDFAAGADNIDLIQTPAREYLPQNAWTMEMYVKINTGGSGNVDFLQFWTTRNEAPTFRIELPNWLFITHGLDGTKRIGAASYLDAWRHIAIVKSGNNLTAYVNGVQQGETSDGYGNFNSAAFNEVTTSSIGTSGAGGQLYQYRIHNRALEASDFTGVQAVVTALNTITVTFDANGGAFPEEGNPPTKTLNILRPATTTALPAANPVKGEKIFAGWFPNADGSGTQFTDNTPVMGNTTVYARWEDEPLPFTLTFNGNGGRWMPDREPEQIITGIVGESAGNKMPANPARGGYVFQGWNTLADGTGTEFTGSTVINYEDMTVYAKWTMDTITTITSISYEVEGSEFVGTLSNGGKVWSTFNDGTTIQTVNDLNVVNFRDGSTNASAANGGYSEVVLDPIAGAFIYEDNWTIEMYFKMDRLNVKLDPLQIYATTINLTSGGTLRIEHGTSGNWIIQTYSPGRQALDVGQRPVQHEWFHVAIVRNGAAITVYFDGEQAATHATYGNYYDHASFNNINNVHVGRAQNAGLYKYIFTKTSKSAADFAAVKDTVNTLNGVSGD
ncbi:MAG: InlB B-repeat-containing protein [Treponema sp.]|jgi:uncharacterized repeat protein (TIGR02543 family)|nr:InlB B-repeat-containing protein [Treponema sp.]